MIRIAGIILALAVIVVYSGTMSTIGMADRQQLSYFRQTTIIQIARNYHPYILEVCAYIWSQLCGKYVRRRS
jgi:cytochrome b subunit of formate dehydrogenase